MNPALQYFQRRHDSIRLAARGADVAILSDSDGYVTYGQDAERIVTAMKRRVLPTTLGSDDNGPFRSVVLSPDRVAETIRACTEQGHAWSASSRCLRSNPLCPTTNRLRRSASYDTTRENSRFG